MWPKGQTDDKNVSSALWSVAVLLDLSPQHRVALAGDCVLRLKDGAVINSVTSAAHFSSLVHDQHDREPKRPSDMVLRLV